MLICEICKKNPATVHLTEIRNNEKREEHLCEECAQQKGVSLKPATLSVASILPTLIGDKLTEEFRELMDQTCPTCGMTYKEFRSKGRLGCPNDYDVFKKGLEPLIERIHGHIQHIGKAPKETGRRMSREGEILKLRQELKRVIKKEEYEQAAEIRDKINKLEIELES